MYLPEIGKIVRSPKNLQKEMIDTYNSGYEAPKYLHQQPGFEYTERDGIIGKGVTQELDEYINPVIHNPSEFTEGLDTPVWVTYDMLRKDY